MKSFFLETTQSMPEVLRGDGAVGVLADDRVALLGPQHVHGLGAVRRDVELRAGRRTASHSASPYQARHVDLVGQLAGEGDPADAGRMPGDQGRRARS